MCGISCIVAVDVQGRSVDQHSQKQSTGTLSARLDKSLGQIKHRGPDSSGIWVSNDERVALGHARLEINDLSPTGGQPLHSTDGTVHTVVNGEIYDYPRLRAEMEEKLEYRFQGSSDCELVLALYQYYGLSFLSKIRGEYSICLFDARRDLFIAVRDRYGIKPLFWTLLDGELLVAAEMKAFLPLGWQPEWDVKNIIGGDTQLGNCTIFKNVQKVRPGHMLICRNHGLINEVQYWQSEYADKNFKETRSEEEMIQGVRDRLLESIQQRLRADVKVGVSLSGGIDSSVVAGMVNHLLREGNQIGNEKENEKLSCFGIAFDEDSGFDESAIANRTAEFLNVKFYKKHMNEQELAKSFEDATWMCEQINYDLNYIGTYALSELFREKGFTVNINGQGSDEIFGGYNIFLPDYLREPDLSFVSDPLSLPENESVRIAQLDKSESTLQQVYQDRLDLNSTSVGRRQLNNILTPQQMACAFTSLPIKREFLPTTTKAAAAQTGYFTSGTISPDFEQAYTESLSPLSLSKIQEKWHPLHSAEYVFVTGHLQNLILSHLGDRGEMAHSVEGRTPFLDHHLTEYVNSLPPSMKIRSVRKKNPNDNNDDDNNNNTADPEAVGIDVADADYEFIEKYVLREAAKPFITEELYKRKKHPYSAPVEFPIGGPIYKVLKELVTVENVERLGFIDTSGIEGGVRDVKEKKKEEEEEGGQASRTVEEQDKEEDGLVDRAFKTRDKLLFRLACTLAQWVMLHRRFGVKKAEVAARMKGDDRKVGANVMFG